MTLHLARFYCAFVLTLSGCALAFGGSVSGRQFYLLSDVRKEDISTRESLPVRLVVRETLASPFVYSQRMIFTRDSVVLGEYQSGYWSEPPPRRFTTLLLLRFADNGNYATVSREASSTIADVELNTDLIECLHDATQDPSTVRVVVSAELVRTKQRKALTRRTFRAEKKVTPENIESAVRGFSEATADVISQITQWTDTEVSKALAEELIFLPNHAPEQS